MARKFEQDQPSLREHENLLKSACGELPALSAAVGADSWLRSRAVRAFREAWLGAHPDGDIVTLRGVGEARQVRLPDLIREFSGGSLFSRDKLVIVRQAEKILFPGSGGVDAGEAEAASGKPGNWEKAFLERVDNPPSGAWLFLECASLPRNRTLGKRLSAAVRTIPCPQPNAREIPVFLREWAQGLGRGLGDEAADLLLRAYGTDLGQLTAEIGKLALFAPEGRDVDADMVREFLTGSIEYDIFAFTNAVEARDSHTAVMYSRRITGQGARDQKGKREDGEKTAHKVMVILAGTMGQMLRARVTMAKGGTPDEFAREEKLSPWRAGRLFESAGRFSLRELRRMVSFMADQVRRTHDTGGDVQLSLETAAVVLTGGRGA